MRNIYLRARVTVGAANLENRILRSMRSTTRQQAKLEQCEHKHTSISILRESESAGFGAGHGPNVRADAGEIRLTF